MTAELGISFQPTELSANMEFNQFLSYGENVAFKAVSWTLIFFGLVCNIPVFTSLCNSQFLEKSRNKYIVSMSVANVMVLIDLAIVPLGGPSPSPAFQTVTCSITELYDFVTEVLIVIVLLDQYRVASEPTVVNAETDNTHIKRRLTTLWATSFVVLIVVSVMQFFLVIGDVSYLVGLLLLMPYTLALGVCAFLVIIIMKTSKLQRVELQEEEHVCRAKRIRRVTNALIVIAIAFFVLILPGKIYVWYWSGNNDESFLQTFSFFVALGYIFAAMVTPVILVIMTSEYRKAFCWCFMSNVPPATRLADSERIQEVKDEPINGMESEQTTLHCDRNDVATEA